MFSILAHNQQQNCVTFGADYEGHNWKSRNGDNLGPLELILWPDQCNHCLVTNQGDQGDRREQDDEGEVKKMRLKNESSSGINQNWGHLRTKVIYEFYLARFLSTLYLNTIVELPKDLEV